MAQQNYRNAGTQVDLNTNDNANAIPVTFITLVGGNIGHGVGDVVRQAAQQANANHYIGTPVAGRGLLGVLGGGAPQRVSPQEYNDQRLDQVLRDTIAVYVTDAANPPGHAGAVIGVSGMNNYLAEYLAHYLGQAGYRVARPRAGANHDTDNPNHLANRHCEEGGVGIMISRLYLGERAPAGGRAQIAQVIANAVLDYMEARGGEQPRGPRDPRGPGDGRGPGDPRNPRGPGDGRGPRNRNNNAGPIDDALEAIRNRIPRWMRD